ncbi:hypothetical protein VTJ49DRAFT_5174 [Mycothermus thermophilus]|uniref:Ribosomal RNA-processing protein 8 n=1 Tax=Humicola insolens TaxID=85995 RepID=A0ABR3V3Q2_HUMIN
MFPVKGFNISAEKLKDETGAPTPAPASTPKPSRKRKRPAQENVTAANLADLWEKVIEHKEQPKNDTKRPKKDHEAPAVKGPAVKSASTEGQKDSSKKSEEKRKKKKEKQEKREQREKQDSKATGDAKDAGAEDKEWTGFDDDEKAGEAPTTATPVGEKGGKKKKKSKGSGSKEDSTQQQQQQTTSPSKKENAVESVKPTAPPTLPKLTPLQASMREKLISARFRHLNETLYTRPSTEAFQLFQDSPEMFTEYHEGFRRQVEVWPENPVDTYIAEIKARAKVRFPPRNNNNQRITPSQLPLPRLHPSKTCTIADLGCGDAKLAAALQPLSRKLHVEVRSFDLQTGGSPLVTRADIANLPLPDASVDVAVFCLALMGTNWLSFVEEAYRILRWRGELWVAEIKSRFAGSKKNKAVAHSVGNRRKPGAAAGGKKKPGKGADDDSDEDDYDMEAELDGSPPSKQAQGQQETDITAFVEALRKRGFLLHRDLGADGAVDMSNKMFVRMHFVKAAPPVKGKYVELEKKKQQQQQSQERAGKGGVEQKPQKQKLKFLEDKDEEDGNEAAILKPCVYKVR